MAELSSKVKVENISIDWSKTTLENSFHKILLHKDSALDIVFHTIQGLPGMLNFQFWGITTLF